MRGSGNRTNELRGGRTNECLCVTSVSKTTDGERADNLCQMLAQSTTIPAQWTEHNHIERKLESSNVVVCVYAYHATKLHDATLSTKTN